MYGASLERAGQLRMTTLQNEFEEIAAVINRALELDREADHARDTRDKDSSARIYEELLTVLAPRAERLVNTTQNNKAFAHFAYGVALRVLHLHEDAIAQLQQSLAIAPDEIDTLLEITVCLGKGGRLREAAQFARRAVRVAPNSAEAWGNLAMTLIQIKEKDSAFDAISKAMALDPANQKNRYILDNFHRYFS